MNVTKISALLLASCFVAVPTSPACVKSCTCFNSNGTSVVNCSTAGLTSVPADIPNDVQWLIMAENSITSVSKEDLKGLNFLKTVDLSNNQLTDGGLPAGTFENLPSFSDLDLSYNEKFDNFPTHLPGNLKTFSFVFNKATHVTERTFSNLTELVHLDISNNQLESIAPGGFKDLRNLGTLDIGFNPIRQDGIPASVFKPANRLQTLGLRSAQLPRVPLDLPGSLQDLDLALNLITELPPHIFSNLTDLQYLSLWLQPSLTRIHDDAFRGLGKLQVLYANSCGVDSVTNSTFNGLSGVRSVDLGSGKITHLPAGAFHQMGNLKSLRLEQNQLTTLEASVLDTRTLPRLSEVQLWGNPWTCDCHLRWLKEHVDNNNTAPTVSYPYLMTCSAPLRLQGRAWDALTPDDFVCGDRHLKTVNRTS
ncbi:podocan-like [Branchiostoma floridae x Branchiostoma belcheri]